MKNKKDTKRAIITILLAAGSSLLLLTGFRTLNDHRGHRWHSDTRDRTAGGLTERRLEQMLDHLDATETQRVEIHAIAENLGEGLGFRHDSMVRLQSALQTQWASDTPDAAQLRVALDDEIEQLRTIGYRMVDQSMALHAALTKEQREEVTKLIDGTNRKRNER
jgi:Spy/CpxP family protein refolding chaperone